MRRKRTGSSHEKAEEENGLSGHSKGLRQGQNETSWKSFLILNDKTSKKAYNQRLMYTIEEGRIQQVGDTQWLGKRRKTKKK